MKQASAPAIRKTICQLGRLPLGLFSRNGIGHNLPGMVLPAMPFSCNFEGHYSVI